MNRTPKRRLRRRKIPHEVLPPSVTVEKKKRRESSKATENKEGTLLIKGRLATGSVEKERHSRVRKTGEGQRKPDGSQSMTVKQKFVRGKAGRGSVYEERGLEPLTSRMKGERGSGRDRTTHLAGFPVDETECIHEKKPNGKNAVGTAREACAKKGM